jgi:hypothetical protein
VVLDEESGIETQFFGQESLLDGVFELDVLLGGFGPLDVLKETETHTVVLRGSAEA